MDETWADLSPPTRLATGFAPAPARHLWRSFFALDRRFAQVLASASEPMLAQIRLTWWRETLARPVAERPVGEPLLAALRAWHGESAALAGLADGWEGMIGEAPLDPAALAGLACARGEAVTAIVRLLAAADHEGMARALGYRWALVDMASRLSDPAERKSVANLIDGAPRPCGAAPRVLRPVAVLCRLEERAMREGRRIGGPGDLATALRIGFLGR